MYEPFVFGLHLIEDTLHELTRIIEMETRVSISLTESKAVTRFLFHVCLTVLKV